MLLESKIPATLKILFMFEVLGFILAGLILDDLRFFLDIKEFLISHLTFEYKNIHFGLLVC